MDYKYLNMETYKRKNHFEYFNSLAFPYVGLTVNVDITDLLKTIKAKKLPFFLSICYCVSKAANRVPEFRQRILNNQIVEYDYCLTSHTVALNDGTYCYCDLDSNRSFEDYIRYAVNEQEKAKQRNSINEEADDILGKIFISTIPWVSYTALINPTPVPADSNPRITWGKYFTENEKVLLPVSVLCHHALVDGLHISKFYDFLNKEMATVAQYS
ncbi:MAG: CatA-like O-acetyltransferase [Marvinbryantia sp.]|uniref:CatA-like O-acetyltransferase n=1 Tax=Marvinbryantia sp. TaxID=2496532 RepID=UPI00399B6254